MFSADLSLSTNMISESLWNIINSFTSALNIFGNFESTLSNIENTTSVWNINGNLSLPSIFDFCFIDVINSSSPNRTSSISTVAGGYFGINVLEEYVARQCSSANFSPSVTPIGYGTCDPFPYQMFDSTLFVQLIIAT
jgi:hypothetical protein